MAVFCTLTVTTICVLLSLVFSYSKYSIGELSAGVGRDKRVFGIVQQTVVKETYPGGC